MLNKLKYIKLQIKMAVFAMAFIAIIQANANTQNVRLEAALDTVNILIGDQINYKLQLLIPPDHQFFWPVIEDTLTGNIEILRKSKIDTIKLRDNLLQISQHFTITSFDTGYYVIPPFKVEYRKNRPDEEVLYAESEPFLLNVFSIPVDLTQPIKPIKGPIALPLTIRELLPYILGTMLLLAIIVLLLTRKKKTAPVVFSKPKPKIPPHIRALAALENLKKEKLWQQGFIKDYYSKLTEIVREYVEERFDVPAFESTTWETLHLIQKKEIQNETKALLKELLELADLVKFAKFKPLPQEHEHFMGVSVKFVETTKPSLSEKTH
jgi:hypothetical protein